MKTLEKPTSLVVPSIVNPLEVDTLPANSSAVVKISINPSITAIGLLISVVLGVTAWQIFAQPGSPAPILQEISKTDSTQGLNN